MASRMERYHSNESISPNSSTKNKNLYRQIDDLNSYTNIEAVATIEKTNEIDLSKVQAMLKKREGYNRRKALRSVLEDEVKELDKLEEQTEEEKNYDIHDLLSKVKEEPQKEKKYRKLDAEEYEFLKNLNLKNKPEESKEEPKEKIEEPIFDDTDDVGLLDDLKSNTMVGDASSIKKIISEEKDVKEDTTNLEDTGIDNSFYTSSFGFTKKDFEELKNINHNIKKSNKFIIILLVALIVVIGGAIVYFILI